MTSSRFMLGLLFFRLCLENINSQFIEVSRDVAHVGDDLTLRCSLDDVPLEPDENPTFSWLFNNKKVIGNGKHFVENGNELYIKNASSHLNGYYSCVVQFTSSGAKLETPHELINFVSDNVKVDTTYEAPCGGYRIPKLCRNKRNKNEEDIATKYVKEGSSITLECHLQWNDINDKNHVKWLKDGNELSLENNEQHSRIEQDRNFQLTIFYVTSEDAGIYDCAAYRDENFKIKSPRRYQLVVDDGFKFTTKPLSTKNLEIGMMGKVHCKAVGSTNIHWIKESSSSLPDDIEDSNGTLIFKNPQLHQIGNYVCIATKDSDTIKTLVEVRIVPTLTKIPPESLEIVEMQTVYLDCQAIGAPQPTIKWFRDGNEIGSEGRFKIFSNGTLQLQEARQDEAGRFECVAGSSAGFKRAETLLIIKGFDSHSSFEDANQEGSFMMSKDVLMTCLVALIYISLVVALMVWCRVKRNRARRSRDDIENKDGENDDTASDGDEENKPLNLETKSSSRNNKIHQNNEKPKKLATSPSSTLIIDHLMIQYDKLNDLTKLGRGEFGEVLSGTIIDSNLPTSLTKLQCVNGNGVKNNENEIQLQQQHVKVLIKSMSRIKDESYFVEFRRQIDLFRAVDSQHVVRLLAISFHKDHHFMILEHHDDLRGFLLKQQSSNISMHQLIEFSKQVVMGLDAISKSKLTHRDIALRNCVISSNNLIIKLSCIALCKDKHSTEYLRKEVGRVVSIKHQAPEILLRSSSYTTASDIYSCAIAIWEILNVGSLPFNGIVNDDFLQLVDSNKVDYESLFTDDKIPFELKTLLMSCWSREPSDRPSPENLIQSLNLLSTKENGDK